MQDEIVGIVIFSVAIIKNNTFEIIIGK